MKIKIYKIAFGSQVNSLGDGRLYYTTGYSENAEMVNGDFVDNPVHLSRKRACVMWRYLRHDDRFQWVHVQGSHVVSESQGRCYPYRAAFEVSRTDVNVMAENANIRIPLMSLVKQFPSIDDNGYTTSNIRCSEDDEILPKLSAKSPEANNLASWMQRSFIEGKHMVIEVSDREARGNKILSQPELQVVLTAIEQLPLELARYASFIFLADENYQRFLNNIFLTISVAGSRLEVTNANVMTWDQVIKTTATLTSAQQNAFQKMKSSVLKGDNERMQSLDNMLQELSLSIQNFGIIANKRASSLNSTQEWNVWLMAEHTMAEAATEANNWSSARNICQFMPENKKASFCREVKNVGKYVQWQDCEEMMEFVGSILTNRELQERQQKCLLTYGPQAPETVPYLFEGCDYKHLLTQDFLEKVSINDGFEQWWSFCKAYNCEKFFADTHKDWNVLTQCIKHESKEWKELLGHFKYEDMNELYTVRNIEEKLWLWEQLLTDKKLFHKKIRENILCELIPFAENPDNWSMLNVEEHKHVLKAVNNRLFLLVKEKNEDELYRWTEDLLKQESIRRQKNVYWAWYVRWRLEKEDKKEKAKAKKSSKVK